MGGPGLDFETWVSRESNDDLRSHYRGADGALAAGLAISHAHLYLLGASRAMNRSELLAVATRYIGDETKARNWIESPHPFLGGKTPIELVVTTEGDALVVQSLLAIAYGTLG